MGVDHGAGAALLRVPAGARRRACSGLFASLDVVLFYIFFEFTLIPLFFLIGLWGGPQRRRAAVTFFLYTLAGSLLTLAGRDRAGGRALSVLAGQRADLLDPRADRGPGRPCSGPSGGTPTRWTSPQVLIFLLLLAGLRDQGADVPVPHLAAAGARRGPDGRLDPAGRRAAQGGQLRAACGSTSA